jgi:NAD(P)H dehydrogenase (quinone)
MSEAAAFAVTGVTGALGGRVARRLEALGQPQRLVVRAGSTAPTLEHSAVAEGSYDDGPAMKRAFDGVDTVFFVSGREARDRLQQHFTVVDAAVAAGVRRVVYTSYLGAAPDATCTLARDHYATEQRIREAGVAFTFLRNSLYLDFLPSMVWEDGAIRGPAGNGRVACVARDDIADVAVAVLTGQGHDGSTYDVTGPAALTFTEMAAELSRVTGRTIRYEAETLEEARSSRAGFGAEAWEVEGWVTSFAAVANGEMDVVSDTVERIAGHPPVSLTDYLARHVDGRS